MIPVTQAVETLHASHPCTLHLPRVRVAVAGDLDRSTRQALVDLERATPANPGWSEREVRLELKRSSIGIAVTIDGREATTARSRRDLADALVGVLNRLVLDTDPAHLHLHAACVELRGPGVLLAGPSGSGKSTVTTELLRLGASYLTDESLTVLPGIANRLRVSEAPDT